MKLVQILLSFVLALQAFSISLELKTNAFNDDLLVQRTKVPPINSKVNCQNSLLEGSISASLEEFKNETEFMMTSKLNSLLVSLSEYKQLPPNNTDANSTNPDFKKTNTEASTLAVEEIETRLEIAISNGGWTAQDSTEILPYTPNLTYEDRMYLLDLFSNALESGVDSVAEFPPPI